MLDGLKLHFQSFGPLAGEDFFTLVQIVLHHLRDGFIVRQVADDTGHIRISGKLAGLLAAVAGHDLIAAILTGTDDSRLGNALVLDAGHHSPHFFIVPDLKGMVLEGVELIQLDIYDLFLATAGSLLRPLGFLRSGSGLHRGSRFFLRFLFGCFFWLFLCGGFGLRSGGLVLILLRGTAPALRLLGLFGLFLFSLGLFRSLRLLFRFLRFCRGRLFSAGSCRPFLGFLFFHNFSEVIDGHLRARCLLFRLFFGSRGSRRFLRLGRSFLARPGIRYRLLRHFRGFIICHKHLPPVFGRKKRGSTFQSSPRGKFLLSPPRYKNTARSLVWAVLCVRLAVHY